MENKKIYADIEFRSGRILRGEKTRELVNLIINKFAEEDLSRDEVIEMTVGKGKTMMYRTCPYCGANLDPGEHCDRQECRERLIGARSNSRQAIVFKSKEVNHGRSKTVTAR